MGKIQGVKLPPRALGSSAVAQKLQIAATDHGGAAFDEANYRVAKRRRFPRIGANTLCPVTDSRDFAVGRALHAAVGSPEHKAQAAALLDRHSTVPRYRALALPTPETDESLDTSQRLGIQRDHSRKRAAGFAAGKEEKLRCGPVVMNGVRSLRTPAKPAYATEPGGLLRQVDGRRRESQHCRIGKRRPQNVLRQG